VVGLPVMLSSVDACREIPDRIMGRFSAGDDVSATADYGFPIEIHSQTEPEAISPSVPRVRCASHHPAAHLCGLLSCLLIQAS